MIHSFSEWLSSGTRRRNLVEANTDKGRKSRSSTGGTWNLCSMAEFDQIKSHNSNVPVLPVTKIMMWPSRKEEADRHQDALRDDVCSPSVSQWGMFLPSSVARPSVAHFFYCSAWWTGRGEEKRQKIGIRRYPTCDPQWDTSSTCVCMSCYTLPGSWQILICTEIASGNLLNFRDN